ncbi:hypothetical protein [Nguyenibacter sp. L1]|uniref:hypothetical protein n=1 Tax=Nguyenibacter sp. L1 TaxID=3049350 RepID=UPI002B4A432E|nr:hypothetical protein [Nguyenibacter sp. L1]WRH89229.1 hypothetical protein QN315_06375 [Nguyenibacter sp. L1]
MFDYENNFDEFMMRLNTQNAIGIWWALGLSDDDTKSMTIREKFAKFKKFFEYAIFHNRIIEYDLKNQRAIFSGDEPDVVFDRIFVDFPLNKLPDHGGDRERAFLEYMYTKFDGWAVLNERTTLCIPD